MVKQSSDRRFPGEPGCFLTVLFDPRYVHVGYEVIRICALEDKHSHGRLGLGMSNKSDQIPDQIGPQRTPKAIAMQPAKPTASEITGGLNLVGTGG